MVPIAASTEKRTLPDLIPDHALVPGEEDLFNHGDFVDRLLTIIKTAPAEHNSVNIALFGSWGSGKSGTSNLLEHRLEEEIRNRQWDGHVATFNALTYARRPLLRRFIVRLAEQLLDSKRAERYRSDVYEQSARPRVEFPELTWERLKRPVGLVAASILAAAVSVALLLLISKGDTREAIRDTLFGVFPALIPTAILVAIVGWALRFLTVTTTRGAPDSDEEFERLFVRLLREDLGVDSRGDKRLVVFIDELDRCSPKEVVATLESLRTFLGVAGCVFIVAADQQALEHALTEEVRQATPADPTNPYYSAGNAYLDKIFQYQLALPPLRPRRLTHYALRLIEGRGGVWQEVDIEDVVSVLLPVHVQSPRRVKVLLNSFALAYATASERAKRGQLEGEPASRGSELAKLVCLRTEFPLFARDLESSDHLPALVLRARHVLENKQDPWEDEVLGAYASDLVGRALLYASGKLPVAELLGERFASSSQSSQIEDAYENGTDKRVDIDEGEEKAVSTVQVAHAVQLISYLEKTADIPGPRDDLVHLEAAGAVWGLDPVLAQQLEDDALGNRPTDVVETVRALEDEATRENALRLLGARTRESVGTDSDNAARALLASLAQAQVPLENVAPALIGDVEHYRRRRGLRAEDLPGAFSIAIAAGHGELLEELLGRDEALEEQDYRLTLAREASRLWPAHGDRLTEVFAAEIGHDCEAASSVLTALPAELAADLLHAAANRAGETLRRDVSTAAREETDPETRQRIETSVEQQLREIAGLSRALVTQERKGLAELALSPLMAVSQGLVLEREVLAELAPLETTEGTLAVVEELTQWEDREIEVELLRSLDPQVLSGTAGAGDGMDSYGRHLWTVLRSPGTEPPEALWTELARLAVAKIGIPLERTAKSVASTLARRVASEAEAAEFDYALALVKRLIAVRLLDERHAADSVLRAVAESVTSPAPTEPEQVAPLLSSWTGDFAEDAEGDDLVAVEVALRSEDCWMPSPERDIMLLVIAGHLVRVGLPVEEYAAREVRELAQEHGSAFASGTAAWLEHFVDSPSEAFRAVEPYISQTLPVALRTPLERYAERLSPAERAEFFMPAVERAFELEPTTDFFRAAHLASADENAIAGSLIALFGKSDNLDERGRVLSIWELLDPKSADARRRLIREIFLPLTLSGATSFDLARRHLKLCAEPPYGTKEQILDTLARAAPDEKRGKLMRKRMVEVSLIEEKKAKGWLRGALRL